MLIALKRPLSEFNEFRTRLKSPKNRFQLSAVLNLKKIEYNFKWSQPYLSRGSNSLNSASCRRSFKDPLFKNDMSDSQWYSHSLSDPVVFQIYNFFCSINSRIEKPQLYIIDSQIEILEYLYQFC